jgi:hypothetical protein
VPNRSEGYCTDDVARAFVVALAADAPDLAKLYLAFLTHAQRPDGRFHNFMSYERTWLDEVGTPDSNGRALWALGYGARFAPRDGWRLLCAERVARALPHVDALVHLRSRAFASFGLAHALAAVATASDGGALRPHRDRLERSLRSVGRDFVARLGAEGGPGWTWFESAFTYDNARLPEALLRIGTVLDDATFVAAGRRALDFYADVTIESGCFVPIGNDGWYVRGGRRARYAQQPLEAAALVDAALAADAALGGYRDLADMGLAWFAGRNSVGVPMATVDGGCFDGLEETGPNRNMGAESTLAYLAAALALAPVPVGVRGARVPGGE